MSKQNTRQTRARGRAGRDRWQVTGRPGHYSAVRDDGPGVTVHRADPAMPGRAAAGERVPRGCTVLDVMHQMTGIPADEDPRLRPAVPGGEGRRDGG
jgi:hypothetical protein